jgi:hypothetical protein
MFYLDQIADEKLLCVLRDPNFCSNNDRSNILGVSTKILLRLILFQRDCY